MIPNPSYRVADKLYNAWEWSATPSSAHPSGTKIERLVYSLAEYKGLEIKPSVGRLHRCPLGFFDITALDEFGLWGEPQAQGHSYP